MIPPRASIYRIRCPLPIPPIDGYVIIVLHCTTFRLLSQFSELLVMSWLLTLQQLNYIVVTMCGLASSVSTSNDNDVKQAIFDFVNQLFSYGSSKKHTNHNYIVIFS